MGWLDWLWNPGGAIQGAALDIIWMAVAAVIMLFGLYVLAAGRPLPRFAGLLMLGGGAVYLFYFA